MTDDEETMDDRITTNAFYERALTAAIDWAKFADPKSLGVLVFLGLGLADLVGRANLLVHAHRHGDISGDIATWAFWLAAVAAAATVWFVHRAVFPRLKPQADRDAQEHSLFFFGGIARYGTVAAYREKVEAATPADLQKEIATQVWEVARIADEKHKEARRAFTAVLFFLVLWVIARVALSIAA